MSSFLMQMIESDVKEDLRFANKNQKARRFWDVSTKAM